MITITRRLEIDAGHRLMGHESKCQNVHGHRYVFEVMFTAEELDNVGRIIDFGVIKDVLGHWLDTQWDHGFIYQAGDPIEEFLRANSQRGFEVKFPPTAENLAKFFLDVARDLMEPYEIRVLAVKLWETPNCYAVAS